VHARARPSALMLCRRCTCHFRDSPAAVLRQVLIEVDVGTLHSSACCGTTEYYTSDSAIVSSGCIATIGTRRCTRRP